MIKNILKKIYLIGYTKIEIITNINKISNKCKTLCSTTESQGHGKAFEIEIQKSIFGLSDETIKSYKSNAKYDISVKDNKYINNENISNNNISIKTSGSNSINCGDIHRFLNSSDLTMFIIKYEQCGDYKIAKKTIIIKHDDIMNKLKNDIEINNVNYEEWINKVTELTENVKNIPIGPVSKNDKVYNKSAKNLSRNLDFSINCKVDSDKQRRVQCTIPISKYTHLDSYEEFDGAMLYDKEYNKMILSPPRKRNGLTIVKLKELCIKHNIWKKNNHLLFYKLIKVNKLIKSELKQYVQEKIPGELEKYCNDNGIKS